MDTFDPHDFEAREVLLDEWVEMRRRIAALEAEAAALLAQRLTVRDADVAEAPMHRDAIWRSMVAEYAAASRMSKGSVEYAFMDAGYLRDLPAVSVAFAAGVISAGHVREIVRAADVVRDAIANGVVPASTLETYAQAVLAVAESETASRTRVHARSIASTLAEQTVALRHREALDERSVSIRPVGDGLALLTAVLPEYLAVAVMDRLTQLARAVMNRSDDTGSTPISEADAAETARLADQAAIERALHLPVELLPDEGGESAYRDEECPEAFPVPFDADYALWGDAIFSLGDTFTTDPFADGAPEFSDERTIDQLRADLFTDLLLTSAPTSHGDGLDAVTARIQVTVAATTLAGADDRLAQLDGHGSLHPDVARDIAARNGGWTRLFLDAAGQITATDTYTPTESMRRRLRARDEHCRFMGCLAPTHRCDIDHQHDHALGGPTSIDNLAHLCRAHHVLKHPDIPDAHRWSATQNSDGSLVWRSPLGRLYTDRPPRRVHFV